MGMVVRTVAKSKPATTRANPRPSMVDSPLLGDLLGLLSNGSRISEELCEQRKLTISYYKEDLNSKEPFVHMLTKRILF